MFARCKRCIKALKVSYDMSYGETIIVGDYGKQTSFCWCICNHELLGDPNSKIYEGGTFTNIICANCNLQTTWDLDAPVPIFLKKQL